MKVSTPINEVPKAHPFEWDGVTPRLPAKKRCWCGMKEKSVFHKPITVPYTDRPEVFEKDLGGFKSGLSLLLRNKSSIKESL